MRGRVVCLDRHVVSILYFILVVEGYRRIMATILGPNVQSWT